MADFPLAQFGALRIASPCPMKWDDMEGKGHIRHCHDCDLNVYNFSEMSPAEIGAVLAARQENDRVCAGWYQRTDGTVIMRDCPVGLRLVRQKLRRTAARIAAAVGMLITGSFALAMPGRDAGKMRTYQPFASLCEWLAPTAPPPVSSWIGGIMAPPPTPPAQSSPPTTSAVTGSAAMPKYSASPTPLVTEP